MTQGTANLPDIKAYVDIVGAGEVPAKGLQKEDLQAKVGSTSVKVSRLIPFEDAKEGVGYVLLVDISKSLSAAQFSLMKETLTAFVDAMSERDQAALVVFGSEVKLLQEFSPNRGKIKEKLAALGPSDEETAFYGGLDKAIAVARSGSSEVPRRRVVITLSDGVNDLTGGISKGDISAKLSADPIPLYLIGYLQGKPTPEEESAIGVMKDFASQSGGRFYDGRGGSWRGIYFAITRSIRSAFVVELDASGFRSEGGVYPVELSLTAANRTWTPRRQLTIPAGGTIAPTAGAATTQPVNQGSPGVGGWNVWLYAGIAAVVALLGGGWFWLRRRSAAVSVELAPFIGASSVPGVLMRLTQIQEGPSPHQFELEIVDRVVLGRDPVLSHLVFENDGEISPAHCEIFFESGCLYVQDLGSSQGTFINGNPLNGRHRIEEQDVLRIGRTELRIAFPT
jgi:Mg-chelatase subunit ChlD